MEVKKFFHYLLGGVSIGIASAIPGVSASAMTVIFKIFEPLVEAINGIKKHFKESLKVLLPILLGAILAFIPMIFLMDKAINNLLFAIVSLFAGFIFGSLSEFKDKFNKKDFKKKEKILLIFAILIPLTFGIISFVYGSAINLEEQIHNPKWYMYIIVLFVGILASTGIIVPGISGGIILLILGFYIPFVKEFTTFIKILFHQMSGSLNWNFFFLLIVFALGIIIGLIIFSKLMNYLLLKYQKSTYIAIFGFIIGSALTLYINNDIHKYYLSWGIIPWYYELIIAVVFLALGLFLGYFLVKYQKKKNL